MRTWHTLKRSVAHRHNAFLTVENHVVETPQGGVIEDWPWIVTPDYVNVVARTEQGLFLFFRQDKYAIEGVSLAPVGGYIDPGEEALQAAQRELLEETGYVAPHWQAAGVFPVDANRGAGRACFFAADRARK